MKIIFMGTPEFSVPALEALIKTHEVLAVVSQPDRPKGRGKKLAHTPVKEVAIKHDIPVFQPEKARGDEFLKTLEKFGADLFVVVAYGQILPKEVLEMAPKGCLNIHGSLLPKYRGAGPIQWSIINGEDVTGVTIMYMEENMDSGDMVLKKEMPIREDETYGELYERMSFVGAQALIEALNLIESKKAKPEKQDHSKATYVGKITKEMGKIDWTKTSKEIIDLIRGLNPAPSTFSRYNDEIFKIHSAEEVLGYTGDVGEIVDIIPKKGIAIKTKDSSIIITEIQAKGGKKMLTTDYLRGHSFQKGEKFS